jgi:hypothetical protein
MRVTIKDRTALESCTPELIEKYIVSRGWVADAGVYVFDNDKIVIPQLVDNSYFGQVSWILMVLERVENRSQLDIWCDITNQTLFFGPGTTEVLKEIDNLLEKDKQDNKDIAHNITDSLRKA